MRKTLITDAIAALFIFLFVYAAASKILDYQQFRIQLGQSPLLTNYAATVVWLIPALEILIAFALAISRFRRTGLWAALFLMCLFTNYIIAITRFSEYIPCSCGGVLSKMSWNQHLAFNIGFVLLAIIALLWPAKPLPFSRPLLQS